MADGRGPGLSVDSRVSCHSHSRSDSHPRHRHLVLVALVLVVSPFSAVASWSGVCSESGQIYTIYMQNNIFGGLNAKV